MQTKRKRGTQTYPQSEGTLALADESLGILQGPKAKPLSPVLRVVQSIPQEDSEASALASATGIMAGIGLSIMLWGLIILVMFWIR